jgi:hypothetical protein
MSANTYCNPRIHIEDIGIYEEIEGSITFPGSNKLTTLEIKLKTNRLAEAALLNKKIKFYLNEGSWDTVPMFIGYIKDATATDTTMSIKAYDARCYLTGEYSKTLVLDDMHNYDGYTLAGFLKSYIDEHINTEETIINTDYINDTNPPVCLIDYRDDGASPYDIVLAAIRDASDTSDTFNIFNYEIVMENTVDEPYLKFKKQLPLDSTASISLSYGDGIQSYQYKKNKIPNTVQIGDIKVDWGGEKNRVAAKKVRLYMKDEGDRVVSTALIANQALKGLKKLREDKYEINVNVTKGAYLQTGQLVYLNVDEEIKGNHRLISKKISFTPDSLKTSFKLNCDRYSGSY